MRRRLIFILLLCLSPSVLAQEADPLENLSREEVVALLDHADFAVREAAEAQLIADATLDQEALRSLLSVAQTDEQRGRLIRIAEHHILRFYRGRDFGDHGLGQIRGEQPQHGSAAVGYTYGTLSPGENPIANQPGLYVLSTMPGFPAYEQLRPGDVIATIGGNPIPLSHDGAGLINWVNFVIGRYTPGQPMQMTVIRNGEQLDLTLTCASREALERMYTSDAYKSAVLAEPYALQLQQAIDALTAGLPERDVLTPAE